MSSSMPFVAVYVPSERRPGQTVRVMGAVLASDYDDAVQYFIGKGFGVVTPDTPNHAWEVVPLEESW